MSEVDTGGVAVEVEPSPKYSIWSAEHFSILVVSVAPAAAMTAPLLGYLWDNLALRRGWVQLWCLVVERRADSFRLD